MSFLNIAPIYSNELADKLIKRIEVSLKEELDSYIKEVDLGLSIGYSIFPDDGDNLNDLLKIADSYMYKVKRK